MPTANPDVNGNNVVTLGTFLKNEGTWRVSSVPVVSTAASASQSAGAAGIKNVCIGLTIMLSAVAAQNAAIFFTLRDGATGAGTILMQWPLGTLLGAGGTYDRTLTGLYVPGTAATAMTLETTIQNGTLQAPVATNFVACMMWGNTET